MKKWVRKEAEKKIPAEGKESIVKCKELYTGKETPGIITIIVSMYMYVTPKGNQINPF